MWTYRQSTGELLSPCGDVAATGYSGFGEGKNNSALESIPDVGPIPRGEYQIGPPYDSDHHGPFVMSLTPQPANEMFGRSAFLMHGDSIEHPGQASRGCTIMPRPIRERVWSSGDHRLQVAEGADAD